MNHILIVIGFLFLLILLGENKENFSQLMMPNYNNAIFTGKSHLDGYKIVNEDRSRKPSPIEDVKQPPYSRFTSGEGNITDSPEDIKEINDRLEEIVEELDITSGRQINLETSDIQSKAICGEKSKKLNKSEFRTPWRKTNANHKTKKLFERFIIEKFAPDPCFWGYESENPEIGCGILSQSCKDIFQDAGGGGVWMNHLDEGAKVATGELIMKCTGYNPLNQSDTDDNMVISDYSCKRLCCDNLLFPMKYLPGSGEGTSRGLKGEKEDRNIYRKYLKYIYDNTGDEDETVPYIEESFSGMYATHIY
jgi:hypothetical protein